jgi:hypothetical protein
MSQDEKHTCRQRGLARIGWSRCAACLREFAKKLQVQKEKIVSRQQ